MSGEGKPKSILRKSKSVKIDVGETEIELQNGKAETSNHAQEQDEGSSVDRRNVEGVVPRGQGQKSLSDTVRTRIVSSWYQASENILIFLIIPRDALFNITQYQAKDSFIPSSLFVLQVLFLDVFITTGDTVTDFLQASIQFLLLGTSIKVFCHQGFNLLKRGDETMNDFTFGTVTLITIWIPGIVAAIHWISENRLERSFTQVTLEACK